MASTTMEATLREMLEPRLSEPLVAVQQFFAADRGMHGSLPMKRIARFVSRQSRVDDQLPDFNALAVTTTRVIIFPAKFSRKTGFTLGEPIIDWPREAVTGTAQVIELSATGNGGGGTRSTSGSYKKFMRTDLVSPDGPCRCDLPPRERATTSIVKELGLEKLPELKRRWWQ
jgi:hypothetical protein